jgi:hypothetical protein
MTKPSNRVPDLSVDDLSSAITTYLGDSSNAARHRSFDHCFNHFRAFASEQRAEGRASAPHLETACVHLGFYLASWGMYRGSSQLIKHSAERLKPVVMAIAEAPEEIWTIDAGGYDETALDLMFATAKKIRAAFPGRASDTLVTKTMLGTFGCVPAFDSYFRRGFGVHTFNRTALRRIDAFVSRHSDAVQNAQSHTIDFSTGEPTPNQYTAAKIVDMIFFVRGGGNLD